MDVLPRLRQLGVYEVWVRHRDLEFLEDIIDEELCEHQRNVYQHVRENFEAIMRDSSVELDLSHFEASISELFTFLKKSPTSGILLQKLDAFDNYLMSHSANVCYLALLVGMRLDRYIIEQRRYKTAREAKDLNMLGLGCLLHDIGKMRIPGDMLHKPGKLTADEMTEMRRHTLYGYGLARRSIPAPAAQIILNHHQRWDGMGYPNRVNHLGGEDLPPLSGAQIPIFSRIATIADVYDAATTQRCYSMPKPPVQVLHEMRTSCRSFFDPKVAEAFFRTVPAFPIGQVVMLSDGTEAVVVDFNPDFPVRPKVQALHMPNGERVTDPSLEEIDLALYADVEICTVDGFDVRPFTASQEVLTTASMFF